MSEQQTPNQDQVLRESYYETLKTLEKLVTALKPIIEEVSGSSASMFGAVQVILPKIKQIGPVIDETMRVVEPKLEAHLPLLEAYFTDG
jgi:hypothetical protein